MKKFVKKLVIILGLVAVMLECFGCSKFSNGKSEERKTDTSWSITADDLSRTLDNTFTIKDGQNLQLNIDVMDGKVTVKVADYSTGETYLEVDVSETTSKTVKCEGKVKVTYKFSKFTGNVSAKVDGKVIE